VPLREQVLLSWGGLRGAVPIVLATVPVVAGVPGSEALVELVFVLVVVFTLLQAPTLPGLAARLGLARDEAVDLEVESSPLGALGAEVLQVRVGPGSRLHGLEVFELRLPRGADVSLVVRGGEAMVPEARTALRHGDDLLVITLAGVRTATEDRLRALSEAGRLAAWRAAAAPTAPAPARRRALRHLGR